MRGSDGGRRSAADRLSWCRHRHAGGWPHAAIRRQDCSELRLSPAAGPSGGLNLNRLDHLTSRRRAAATTTWPSSASTQERTCSPASPTSPHCAPSSKAARSPSATPARRPTPRLPCSSTPSTPRSKDWETFTRQAVEFHLKNARAWASTATGQDLTAQVDPGLIMGTQLTNPPGERVRSARCLDPPSEDSARRDGLAEKLLDDRASSR